MRTLANVACGSSGVALGQARIRDASTDRLAAFNAFGLESTCQPFRWRAETDQSADSGRRQLVQQFAVDQCLEVIGNSQGQGPLTNKQPKLNIAVEPGFREVRRRHEYRFII